jgi:P-type Ca2+ transporter type 2C
MVVDPPDDDVLQRRPRDPDEPMLGRAQWLFIIATGLLQAGVTMALFVWALAARTLPEARNVAFSVLVFGESFRAFAARSTSRLFWEVGAFTNLRLPGVVVFPVVVQLGIHHVPAAQEIFEIGPRSAADCVFTLLAALIPVSAIELSKVARRGRVRAQERRTAD